MFWIVMTAIAVTVTVIYGAIGALGVRWWGLSPERAKKFALSAWLALGWTAVCLGRIALSK